MKSYYKCRFCTWKTLKWFTNKKGKIRNQYYRLENHIMIHHEEEYQAVIDKVALEMGEELR